VQIVSHGVDLFVFLLHCLMIFTVGNRFDSEKAGDREVQRTMLELLNQLDGFQPNNDIKVGIMYNTYVEFL